MPVDVTRIIGHREWAPGRKSDPTYNMGWRRAGAAGIVPRTPTRPEDDAMTKEDRKYFDERFGDLWARFGVRTGPDGQITGDRLDDLWRAIGEVTARLDTLTTTGTGIGPSATQIAEQVTTEAGRRLLNPSP